MLAVSLNPFALHQHRGQPVPDHWIARAQFEGVSQVNGRLGPTSAAGEKLASAGLDPGTRGLRHRRRGKELGIDLFRLGEPSLTQEDGGQVTHNGAYGRTTVAEN